MLKQPIPTVHSFVLALLTVAFPTVASAQTNHISRPLKAGNLMGKRVEDADGNQLGIVRNLVFDTQTGRLQYVILGSGGFLGLGTKFRVVPPQLLSAATAKRETLAIHLTKDRWRNAPTVSTSQLASLGQRTDQIAQYYGQSETDTHHAETTRGENNMSATGAKVGRTYPHSSLDLKLASDIIGQRVINPDGEKLGEVLDILVSFGDTQNAFAIISSGRFFHNRESQYAVPLRAFTTSRDRGKLVLNASPATLQQSPLFTPRVWDSGIGKEIYRYDEETQHTVIHLPKKTFQLTQQPTNEKERYGKSQFTRKPAVA